MIVQKWVHMATRLTIATCLTFLAGVCPGMAAADLSSTAEFNIVPQQLPSALLKYSEQSGVLVTSAAELVQGKATPGVVGTYPARQALDRLLAGTALGYEVIGSNTITIFALPSRGKVGAPAPATAPAAVVSAAATPASDAEKGGQKRSLWDRFRLAQTDQGQAAGSSADTESASAGNQPVGVEEVIVTAQKRLERLQDVPVPVTAVTADSLVDSNQFQLRDYYTRVPGLAFTPGGFGEPTIAIRGVIADYGANPAVGVTIDDVPWASTGIGGGLATPDFDPTDLSRVEVLRGPQGTLYGASSLGGLLKFVTSDPSTERLTGRAQAGLSTVEHGELGYSARGSVNVPLNETFALRTSGFIRRDPGYVDDVQTGEDDTNRTNVYGGRVAALWQASEDLALKLSALYQQSNLRGSNFVDREPGLESLEQDRIPGSGVLDRKTRFLSANLKARLGSLDFTSLTGYGKDDYRATGFLRYSPAS